MIRDEIKTAVIRAMEEYYQHKNDDVELINAGAFVDNTRYTLNFSTVNNTVMVGNETTPFSDGVIALNADGRANDSVIEQITALIEKDRNTL